MNASDLEAITNAEMHSQWPEELRAVEKCLSKTGVMEMGLYFMISWSAGKGMMCNLPAGRLLPPFEASRT
jgi:hypothetical protein